MQVEMWGPPLDEDLYVFDLHGPCGHLCGSLEKGNSVYFMVSVPNYEDCIKEYMQIELSLQ